jgi:hypothetical protein
VDNNTLRAALTNLRSLEEFAYLFPCPPFSVLDDEWQEVLGDNFIEFLLGSDNPCPKLRIASLGFVEWAPAGLERLLKQRVPCTRERELYCPIYWSVRVLI